MKKLFIALSILILAPVFTWALDFEMSLKDKISSLNIEASTSGGGDRIAKSLSLELGVREDIILQHKMRTGLDWGNLTVALYISNRTGKDIDVIVKDHRRGHAWGKIAKAYGIRTDDLLTTMGKAHAASKHGKGQEKGNDEKGFEEPKGHGQGKGKGH